MSKSKRSPGPWKATGTAIRCDGPRIPFLVAEVTKPTSDANGIDWQANAALIAAAPDMLSVLEKLMGDTECPDYIAAYILPAIAKARGES